MVFNEIYSSKIITVTIYQNFVKFLYEAQPCWDQNLRTQWEKVVQMRAFPCKGGGERVTFSQSLRTYHLKAPILIIW